MLNHKIKIPEGMDAVEFARLARPTVWQENQVLGDEIQRLNKEVEKQKTRADRYLDRLMIATQLLSEATGVGYDETWLRIADKETEWNRQEGEGS